MEAVEAGSKSTFGARTKVHPYLVASKSVESIHSSGRAWDSFKNSGDFFLYHNFRRSYLNTTNVLVVVLSASLAWIFSNLYILNVFSSGEISVEANVVVGMFGWFVYLISIIGAGTAIVMLSKLCNIKSKATRSSSSSIIWVLECWFVLGPSVGSGLSLLAQSLSQECESSEDNNLWHSTLCNPQYGSSWLPLESTLLTLITPLLLFSVCNCPVLSLFLTSWTIATGFIVAAMVVSSAYSSFMVLIIAVALASQVINSDSEMKMVFAKSFRGNSRSRTPDLAAVSKLQAFALSNVISNISHDLQSPMHALEMGLELLSTTLRDSKLMTSTTTTSTTPHSPRGSGDSGKAAEIVDYSHLGRDLEIARTEMIEMQGGLSGAGTDEGKKVIVPSLKYTSKPSSLSLHSSDTSRSSSRLSDSNRVKFSHHSGADSSVRSSQSSRSHVKSDNLICLEMIRSMECAVMLMSMIISRCIDFSKTSSGIDLVPCMECFSLNAAVSKAVQCINDMQSVFRVEIFRDTLLPPEVVTDKRWFEGNLLCLLSNAVKYSNYQRGEPVQVHLSSDFTGADNHHHGTNQEYHVTVSITDSGSNVDIDTLSTFFLPPDSMQRSEMGGSGLGLYTLSQRVEAVGGTYGSNRRKDGLEGTTVWFTLPVKYVLSKHHKMERALTRSTISRSSLGDVSARSAMDDVDGGGSVRGDGSVRSSHRRAVPRGDFSSSGHSIRSGHILASGHTSDTPGQTSSLSTHGSGSSGHFDTSRRTTERTVLPQLPEYPSGVCRTEEEPFSDKSRLSDFDVENPKPCIMTALELNNPHHHHHHLHHQASTVATNSARLASSLSGFSQHSSQREAELFSLDVAMASGRYPCLDPPPAAALATDRSREDEVMEFSNEVSTVPISKPPQRVVVERSLPEFLNILIVEDSISIAKIMKLTMERCGHSVTHVGDGLQALEKMKERSFDLVLMDFQMPVMGGIETVTRYREFESEMRSRQAANTVSSRGDGDGDGDGGGQKERLLIIGMSANGDSAARLQAAECGMDAFLPKPFSIDGLMAVIDAL